MLPCLFEPIIEDLHNAGELSYSLVSEKRHYISDTFYRQLYYASSFYKSLFYTLEAAFCHSCTNVKISNLIAIVDTNLQHCFVLLSSSFSNLTYICQELFERLYRVFSVLGKVLVYCYIYRLVSTCSFLTACDDRLSSHIVERKTNGVTIFSFFGDSSVNTKKLLSTKMVFLKTTYYK